MWGQVERFAKASSKRATTIGAFLETFKRKMGCSTINPKWCDTNENLATAVVNDDGTIMVSNEKRRQFMIDVIENNDDDKVLYQLYKETARAVMLVRDRLERERPLEAQFKEMNLLGDE